MSPGLLHARLEGLVRALCAEACAGRAPGTPGSARAREVICGELELLGLSPVLQAVPASRGTNVLARIPGRGPRAGRAILLGAHYDHLGLGAKGEVYAGADDNAAAVAILLATTRLVAARASELGREVIFAWFDAEEPPHFLDEGMGSLHYVRHPLTPLDRIDLMVCLDLVGHTLGADSGPAEIRDTVFVLGAELSVGTAALLDELAARHLTAPRGAPRSPEHPRVHLRRLASDVIPTMSDYAAFEAAEVPYLFFTAGRWRHYHRPSDTPEKLAYGKMEALAEVLADLAVEASTRPIGQVVFDAGGRDDAASLATIAAIARGLTRPRQGASLEQALEPLEHELGRRGVLGPRGRQDLAQLVSRIEALLGALGG